MSAGQCYQAKRGVAWDRLREEVALLDPSAGKYFGLNQTGAVLWEALQQPQTVDQLVAVVLAAFRDVDEVVCRADIEALLSELSAHALVEMSDGADAIRE